MTFESCIITQERLSNLWHYPMGHVSKKLLESTISVTEGLKLMKVSDHICQCRSCRIGKPVRQPPYCCTEVANVKMVELPLEKLYSDVIKPNQDSLYQWLKVLRNIVG